MPDIDWIRELCMSLHGATENIQWGDDLCFKVGGKIFTVLGLGNGKFPSVCFKCTPEKFNELLDVEGIKPAPYVGRYKWVLLEHSRVLEAAELDALIRHSYQLVASKVPKDAVSKVGRVRRKRSGKPGQRESR